MRSMLYISKSESLSLASADHDVLNAPALAASALLAVTGLAEVVDFLATTGVAEA